jgi:osmoprotectant transport system substrate-binding protein
MTSRIRSVLALGALAVLLATTGCGGGDGGSGPSATTPRKPAGPTIRLGTKNFTEQYILGELYAQALRARGFRVQLKSDVGSSEIIDSALQLGSLDMYPEYTGVALSELAGERSRPLTAAATYARAKAFERDRGYAMLTPTPFSDSNALAVTPAVARRYGLRTIADLAKVPGGATIGAPPEFRTRFEGLVGLRRRYGLDNVRVRALPIGAQYAALRSGKVDAAAVFTTDGNLQQANYVLLQDPRMLFGFQNVAPVVRRSLLQRAPRLQAALDAVSRRLTTMAMRRMNAAVDLRDEEPAAVARRFLLDAGLL